MSRYTVTADVLDPDLGWQPYLSFVHARGDGLPDRDRVTWQVQVDAGEAMAVDPTRVQVRNLRVAPVEDLLSLVGAQG